VTESSPTPSRAPRTWNRTTWVLSMLVLVTAASTLVEMRDPALPGTLRLGVLRPGDPRGVDLVLAPFAAYLGQEIHRRVVIEEIDPAAVEQASDLFDLALLPLHGAVKVEEVSVLAWAKSAGRSGWRSAVGVLRTRDVPWPPEPGRRLIFGDAVTWSGYHGALEPLEGWGWSDAEIAASVRGKDPFDHQGAIASLVYGAFDYAVVREMDVYAAIRIGRLPRQGFVYTRVGEPRGDFALVAGTELSDAARNRVRDAALNLDHYRQDPSRLRAGAASHALGELGLSGFAPDELLPSLRP
jgi:ABC transporter, phosphonate, periplasmic substrate-binding protein